MPHEDSLIWRLDQQLRAPFVVGEGCVLYLSGWCYHARRRIRHLSLLMDDRPHQIVNHSLANVELFSGQAASFDKTGESLTSGFWTTIPFDKISHPASVELTLRAVLDNGEMCDSLIGTLGLVPSVERVAATSSPDALAANGESFVAICMATHNPPPELFTSQIESIVSQTHQNWVCIINDDCSAETSWEFIQKTVAGDKRFRVSRNAERLGFYRNFERCLQLVPPEAAFVALADQDDYWYPSKLEKCLAAVEPNVSMVYSDMEVADCDGEAVAKTLWATRENNYTDLEALIYANTVTGASTMFRADLLGELLPFPNLPGNFYHDHWLACLALTKGAVGYVAEPLYVWRQHESNACGFARSQPARIKKWMELKTFGYLLVLFLRRATHFGAYLEILREQYWNYFVGVVVLAQTLRRRVQNPAKDKRAVLERFSKSERSLSALAVQAFKSIIFRRASCGRELTSFRVALSIRLLTIYCRLTRHLFCRRRTRELPAVADSSTPSVN